MPKKAAAKKQAGTNSSHVADAVAAKFKKAAVKKNVGNRPATRLAAKKKRAVSKAVAAKQAATRDVVLVNDIGPSDHSEIEAAAVRGKTRSLKSFRDELGW